MNSTQNDVFFDISPVKLAHQVCLQILSYT